MPLLASVATIPAETRHLSFTKKGEKLNFSFYYYNIIGNAEEMWYSFLISYLIDTQIGLTSSTLSSLIGIETMRRQYSVQSVIFLHLPLGEKGVFLEPDIYYQLSNWAKPFFIKHATLFSRNSICLPSF